MDGYKKVDMYMRRYAPGDIAVITPKNLPEEVDAFLTMMQWNNLADRLVRITPASKGKLTSSWDDGYSDQP